jgi:predicted permease
VELLKIPTMPAFLIGLGLRAVSFPNWLALGLQGFAWSMVMFSLVLMGMRLQQLRSWDKLLPTVAAGGIRMVLTPLVIGLAITALGLQGPPRLVMVLQAGMPSALATLVLAETFNLDRELAVTSVGITSAALFVTLPLWLLIFPP